MFDFLEDNLLIITPNSYKFEILKYLNDNKLIMNIKFMTKTEYKKSIKFDYGIDAIHFLKNQDMKVENAITILDNLYYIEDKDYHNEKLNKLVNYKKELDSNNLLIYDKLFSKILKRRKIIVYGYGLLNTFDTNMFMDAMVIPYEKKDKEYDVYHFVNIKDEVEFVFQKISDLLNKGIDINNISLMNIDSEYFPYIKRMEEFYNIKVLIKNTDTIIGTIIGKKFISLIESGLDVDSILNNLKKYEDSREYSYLINILNKYSDYNLVDYLDEIKYDISNSLVKEDIYENVVKIKDMFDYVNDSEYVFLMNFNSTSIPKLKMDTDYITDDICHLVGVDSKDNENELIKENTLNYLSSINNIIISYKDRSPFNKYNPSFLLENINYKVINYERRYNYSNKANKSIYSMYLDDLVKYGIKNDNLSLLYSTYGNNNYLEYKNEFSGLSKNKLIDYLEKERIKHNLETDLNLSYSSIDNFYKCGFKYYLNNILCVNIFEETFNTIIGQVFHKVLSEMNEDNFDFNESYANAINEYKFKERDYNNKEKFFFERLKKDLEYIISVIKKHQFISSFTKYLYEHKIDIKLMDKPSVHFKGYVDKIMYKDNGSETLVSIVDYKTGKQDEVNIKNLEFGLSMQLPVYLYLANNCDKLKNIKFTGFYLERILNLDVIKQPGKSIDELKYDSLKLDGYSTNDKERLGKFDSTFENSEMIKSMRVKQDGSFYSYSKTLTDEEINEILLKVDERIKNAMEEILGCNFQINPKILNGTDKSCKFCDFKDICYHSDKDYVYLDDYEIDEV